MSRYRKAAAAAAGVLAQLVAAGAIPEQWRPWASVVLAVATALGVYAAPNSPARDGAHEA